MRAQVSSVRVEARGPRHRRERADPREADRISGIERLGLPMPVYFSQTLVQYRYALRVFMVPLWREIFAQDAERQHSFAEAEKEFYGLQQAYKANNYEVILIPKLPVHERADFIERALLHSS